MGGAFAGVKGIDILDATKLRASGYELKLVIIIGRNRDVYPSEHCNEDPGPALLNKPVVWVLHRVMNRLNLRRFIENAEWIPELDLLTRPVGQTVACMVCSTDFSLTANEPASASILAAVPSPATPAR